MDSEVRHIVQYHVNSILFQAQMGTLGKGQQQMIPQQQPFILSQQFPVQVQQQFFPHKKPKGPHNCGNEWQGLPKIYDLSIYSKNSGILAFLVELIS